MNRHRFVTAAASLAAVAALACVVPATSFAATLPVTGHLRSVAGGPVADGVYVVIFKLYDSVDAVVPLWDDTLQKVAVWGGGFAVELGLTAGKPIPDAWLTSGKPMWIGVAVGSEEELSRVAIGAVPASWFAHNAAAGSFAYAASTEPGGPATSLACTGCVDAAAIAVNAVTPNHVSFTYAGSDEKGGPATDAKHAALADAAKNADHATDADMAKVAASALSAEELACSGCVTLNHLADNVANGFLSTKGGDVDGDVAVTGTLGVKGSLQLGDSTIQGGRFAAVDVAQTPCGAGQLGAVAVDAVTKRLYFCDGTSFQRITLCSEVCPAANSIDCGKAILNSCGEGGGCKGTGTWCASGICTDQGCKSPGQDKSTAGLSCKDLLAAAPEANDGTYWIDPTGGDHDDAFEVHCDMTTAGGGWARCLAFHYLAPKPSGWSKKWLSTVWKSGADYALDAAQSSTKLGNTCPLLAAGAKEIYGEVRYPSGFGTNFKTSALPLPADFFGAGNNVKASGASQNVIAKDSTANGYYGSSCGSLWTGTQGIQGLCISSGGQWQGQHTGWGANGYQSCMDSSNQPCTCSPQGACGGSNTNEMKTTMSLYLR
mgnify:CR=1 FL=1